MTKDTTTPQTSVDPSTEPVIVQRLDGIGERIDRCTETVRELIVELSA
jgi:hypothetical protein